MMKETNEKDNLKKSCNLNLETLFKKVVTNEYLATTWEKNKDGNFEKTFQKYRRDDLWNWSKAAFERGEKYFYCEPVNLQNPCGKLRLCEPHYVYKLTRYLTEEEYTDLVEKFKN